MQILFFSTSFFLYYTLHLPAVAHIYCRFRKIHVLADMKKEHKQLIVLKYFFF